jgi:hypothetical protein
MPLTWSGTSSGPRAENFQMLERGSFLASSERPEPSSEGASVSEPDLFSFGLEQVLSDHLPGAQRFASPGAVRLWTGRSSPLPGAQSASAPGAASALFVLHTAQ